MLPLILGGLAAMRLLKRNPRRRRRNPHGLAAYAQRVIQALVWTFSAAPKIPRAAMGMVREAFRRDIDAEAVAGWISAGKMSLPASIRGAFPKLKGELRAWATRNRINPRIGKPAAILLKHGPNPDITGGYWHGRPSGPPFELVKISSFREASQKAQAYISRLELGGGNWYGGQIFDAQGNQIAHVSYNGRVWPGKGWDPKSKEIKLNPGGAMVRGTKRLASRLFNWHGGQGSGIYEVASNWHSGRPARIEAVSDAWRELAQSLKRVTEMQGKGYTKRDLADITGLTRRLGLIAASHEGMGTNPKRSWRGGRVTPSGAAARLAQWRWHHNPRRSIYVGLKLALRKKGFKTFIFRDAEDESTDPQIDLGGGLSLSLDNAGWPCGVVYITEKPEWTMFDRYWQDDPSLPEIANRVEAFAKKHGLTGVERNPTWDIQAGDRVTIRTPQGQKRTGRAVMRGPGGWVLNLGGRYGTPGIAAPENIVSVRRGKRRGPTRLDYRQFEADVPGTREA